jgi:hypothetical protein
MLAAFLSALLVLGLSPHGPAVAGDWPTAHLRAGSAASSSLLGLPLRLRGGKAGRRTRPAKVPEQFWTKRYQADWDKLKITKRVLDPERGYRRTPYVKMPGSYWAFGKRLPDRAPNMTVGRDIAYEQAYLKSGRCLFHPDTMEPLNPKRIWGDPDDPWWDLRWDERDIDEEIRARMQRADIYHPYVAKVLRYQCENDAFRARCSRESTAHLSTTGTASKSVDASTDLRERVEVPADGCSIPSALMLLREREMLARGRHAPLPNHGGAAQGEVLVAPGVHSWADLNAKQVVALPRARISVAALRYASISRSRLLLNGPISRSLLIFFWRTSARNCHGARRAKGALCWSTKMRRTIFSCPSPRRRSKGDRRGREVGAGRRVETWCLQMWGGGKAMGKEYRGEGWVGRGGGGGWGERRWMLTRRF